MNRLVQNTLHRPARRHGRPAPGGTCEPLGPEHPPAPAAPRRVGGCGLGGSRYGDMGPAATAYGPLHPQAAVLPPPGRRFGDEQFGSVMPAPRGLCRPPGWPLALVLPILQGCGSKICIPQPAAPLLRPPRGHQPRIVHNLSTPLTCMAADIAQCAGGVLARRTRQ